MIRTDDWQRGTAIEENILANSVVGGITLKGENIVRDNILVNVGIQQEDQIHTKEGWGPFGITVIEHNVFYNPAATSGSTTGSTPRRLAN